MSAQLIDNLMEKIHVLTQENKRLKDENKTKTETIERLGGAFAQNRSTGMAQQNHGVAREDAGVCGADRVVGLFCGQGSPETLE
jgi:cell division septum initiation protein DivIVA